MTPIEALANAIIEQAVKDYRNACFLLRQGRFKGDVKTMKLDCERFFSSEWFTALTILDGPRILDRLRKEVAE